MKDSNIIIVSKIIEDIEESRIINHEAYLDDGDRYRLGKSDSYCEILMMLRKAFNLG